MDILDYSNWTLSNTATSNPIQMTNSANCPDSGNCWQICGQNNPSGGSYLYRIDSTFAFSNIFMKFNLAVGDANICRILYNHDNIGDNTWNTLYEQSQENTKYIDQTIYTNSITSDNNGVGIKLLTLDNNGGCCYWSNVRMRGTKIPTTAAPTTITTMTPTTSSPTTSSPSTSSPTTSIPTTSSPTTAIPTTANPTTSVPTTESPTTGEPTTYSPSSSPVNIISTVKDTPQPTNDQKAPETTTNNKPPNKMSTTNKSEEDEIGLFSGTHLVYLIIGLIGFICLFACINVILCYRKWSTTKLSQQNSESNLASMHCHAQHQNSESDSNVNEINDEIDKENDNEIQEEIDEDTSEIRMNNNPLSYSNNDNIIAPQLIIMDDNNNTNYINKYMIDNMDDDNEHDQQETIGHNQALQTNGYIDNDSGTDEGTDNSNDDDMDDDDDTHDNNQYVEQIFDGNTINGNYNQEGFHE